MKVVLCEDNIVFRQQLVNYIKNYAMIEDNGIEITLATSDPLQIISYVQNESADCYFLDIDLDCEITGLDLAKQIRLVDPIASIIFVTTHSEMLQLTFSYRVEALDFIIKDDYLGIKRNILSALKTSFDKYKKIGNNIPTRFYQFKVGEFVKNIPMQDLLYFQASDVPHKIKLHTLQGQFEFYQSLKTIENEDTSFFRCHRAFILNIENIIEIDTKHKYVIMKNGETCPIAFRRVKPLEQALLALSSK